MEFERISAAALLWAVALFGVYLCRRRSPLHWMVVALLVTALGGSFFPVLSLFVPPATWRNVSHLEHETLLSVQMQFTAWTAGLVLAVFFASERGWLAARSRETLHGSSDATRRRDLFMASALVVLGGLLYAEYVRRVGVASLTSREDYAEKYLRSTGLGAYLFGLSMVMAGCLWAEDSDISRGKKNLFALVAIAISVWSVAFISVRTNFLILLLGYLYLFCERRRVELRRVRVALVIGLLCAYVGLESFSLFRGAYRGDLREAWTVLEQRGPEAFSSVVGGSELSHPFITAAEVVQSRTAGELGGQNYLDAVEALMPLAIDPDRPLVLSERFVMSNYAEIASRGGGTAFSIVAEAWLALGSIFGPLIAGLFFGAILVHVERRRATHPSGITARLAPYLLFFVAVEHRNESATLLKQVFMIAAVVVPLWISAQAVQGAFSRRAMTISPLRVARGRS